MRAVICVVLGLLFLVGPLSGQTELGRVAESQELRLEEALKRLAELRGKIQEERTPLVRRLNELDARVAELESEVRQVRRAREMEQAGFERLRERIEGEQREVDYIQKTLFPGFVANLEVSMTPVERPRLGETMRNYNLFLENSDVTELEKLRRGLSLISAAFRSTEQRLGGQIAPGEALGPDGRIREGRFVAAGPLVFFSEENGNLSGLIDVAPGSLDAHLQPLRAKAAAAIASVAEKGEGILPIDPSLGNALAIEKTRDTVSEHLVKGGIWVFPILGFALAATVVAVLKTVQIFRIRHPRAELIPEIVTALRGGNLEKARELAAEQPEPARGMLLAGVEHSGESAEMIEEVMYERMLTEQPKLERFLNVIAVTAAAAPLLGLLGTVTGIIKTFQLMTVFGAGDPKPLISGISEALITTELGLILAIPALVLHAILSRRVAGILARMEKTAVAFVNGLSRQRAKGEVVE